MLRVLINQRCKSQGNKQSQHSVSYFASSFQKLLSKKPWFTYLEDTLLRWICNELNKLVSIHDSISVCRSIIVWSSQIVADVFTNIEYYLCLLDIRLFFTKQSIRCNLQVDFGMIYVFCPVCIKTRVLYFLSQWCSSLSRISELQWLLLFKL